MSENDAAWFRIRRVGVVDIGSKYLGWLTMLLVRFFRGWVRSTPLASRNRGSIQTVTESPVGHFRESNPKLLSSTNLLF